MSAKVLNVEWMYFNGIRDGKITAVFFDTEKLPDLKKGDLFEISFYKHTLKMYFNYSKKISFRQVSEDLAKKAGFETRELLCDHLINKYNISSFPLFNTESLIDDELFYVIVFTDDPEKITYGDGEREYKPKFIDSIKSITMDSDSCSPKVKLYENSPYYINEMYNPEYDTKFWTKEMKE